MIDVGSGTDLGSLDRYARLVQRLLAVRTSQVNLIADDAQVVLGAAGLAEPYETTRLMPLSHSYCRYVVEDGEPLVVTDVREDPRLATSPVVSELGVVAYAGWPLRTAGGEVVGAVCAIDDRPHAWSEAELADLADLAAACSTELSYRALAGELADTVEELRRSNDQLAAFAAQLSHDLRNPLTALSSSLQHLDQARAVEPVDAELVGSLVGRARRSTSRMSDLVTSVLAFAIVGGRLAVEEVDVAAVLGSVLDDLERPTDTMVSVGPLATVCADAVQLRIAVQNLVSNALTHAAGSSVEIIATVEVGSWVLRVVDHGPGIPADQRQLVLDPFVRLDRSVPGSGLGLATSVRVAAAHGGQVLVSETPGGGATLSLVLPA